MKFFWNYRLMAAVWETHVTILNPCWIFVQLQRGQFMLMPVLCTVLVQNPVLSKLERIKRLILQEEYERSSEYSARPQTWFWNPGQSEIITIGATRRPKASSSSSALGYMNARYIFRILDACDGLSSIAEHVLSIFYRGILPFGFEMEHCLYMKAPYWTSEEI